jgi:signal transduction histidine kinase
MGIAQNNLPPVYEIKSDTALIDTLPNNYWQILKDTNGKLTFEQVSKSPVADKFHYDSPVGITHYITAYWSRFILKNVTDHKISIGFYDKGLQSSDWYIITDTEIIRKKSGFETPWSKNDDVKFIGYSLMTFLPVTMRPGGELLFYSRTQYDYFNLGASNTYIPTHFTITFGFTDKMIAHNYIEDESHYFIGIDDSFLFGVMILAAIFSFLFFLIVKERVYLYFALYVFFLGFGRFNIEWEFYHVFLREHPFAYAYIINFVWLFPDLFLFIFLRSLLEIKKYYPRWDKVVVSLILLYAPFYVINTFLRIYLSGTNYQNLQSWVSVAPDIVSHSIFLFTFFIYLKQNIQSKKWLLRAIFPSYAIWVMGAETMQLGAYTHLARGSIIVWLSRNWDLIETICLCWQVLCLSWFLLHYFVELRKQIVQKELEKEIERRQLIAQQKIELEKTVEERTTELKQSLHDLKSTQAQLIQSEKMASLGELTAGIAHEIQNPLNFVNNFSELSNEMLDEMKVELATGNRQLATEIADDIKQNLEKINHHGKRADAIVKGMLQHSRASSGVKEATDINKLADEYLRLSYHGMRARDKSFNAEFKTDFDESIGKINIVPQDVGRVLLNLFNNAFYTVNEKKKTADEHYEPTVSIVTKRINSPLEPVPNSLGEAGGIEIRVADNGNGIPQNIVDKIFQPFFTTKPTGQGTGLGLSLAYDIVKAHGGEIKVKTKEEEGSEFIIQLPIT